MGNDQRTAYIASAQHIQDTIALLDEHGGSAAHLVGGSQRDGLMAPLRTILASLLDEDGYVVEDGYTTQDRVQVLMDHLAGNETVEEALRSEAAEGAWPCAA